MACAYECWRSNHTTMLPSSWKTSLLWPSGDARVWPGLRVSPANRELRACAVRSTLDCMGAPQQEIAASARGTLKLQGSIRNHGVRPPHLLLVVIATIAAGAHASAHARAHAGARARASSAIPRAIASSVSDRALLGLPSSVLRGQNRQSAADTMTVQCSKDAVNSRAQDCAALKECRLKYSPNSHWTYKPVHPISNKEPLGSKSKLHCHQALQVLT